MRLVMHPEMVYDYPIWTVGLLLIGLSALGAMLIELVVRRFAPAELRRRHNDVAAAMLSIIGVTYAVLLAFVAMLAWDGFNKAKATSFQEAAAILDVQTASSGLPEPQHANVRDALIAYTRAVVGVEWPAQAAGRTVDGGTVYLARLSAMAGGFVPRSAGEANIQAQLLQALMRLSDAREERLSAALSAVPGIVWLVLILGGALTVAFGSFLGAPSLGMHLAMSSLLAVSGALVLLLIIALSHPFRGDFRVSTQPFEQALRQMADVPSPQ